ncbi:MAG: S41 family peptidase [Paludibacteraceae bacterium]|nr:S41 family peptidase [Paludibacteraceae bacterium]
MRTTNNRINAKFGICRYLIGLCIAMFSFSSCDKDLEVTTNSAMENYDMLWKVVDENYCFFEYKKDSIKDWDEVYREYLPMVKACKTKTDLFYIFSDVLNELKDGHVNLISSFDVSRYDIQGDYPDNYDSKIIRKDHYLGKDYKTAGGLRYKLLEDKVGYISYTSFSNSFTDDNLDYVLKLFRNTDGIIIDLRNNGGGYASLVDVFASRFARSKTLVGYWQHKTGKGHADLSEPEPQYLEPSEKISYFGKVALLTNRNCFSATNDFVQTMKALPKVKQFGDRTGGGAGMPMSSELPIGWSFRLSVSPYLDINKKYTEFGIDPDVHVDMLDADAVNGYDTIIESARKWIKYGTLITTL